MIENIVLASAWTWGIHCLFAEGYLLEHVGNKIRETIGSWTKPLFDCPPCQSSFHGVFIGAIIYGPSLKILPFVIALCGLNFLVKNIVYPEYENPE